MAPLPDPTSSTTPISLAAFLQQSGAKRFLAVRDGELVCLAPESAEAQRLYAYVVAALAEGTITDLRAVSGMSDGEIRPTR